MIPACSCPVVSLCLTAPWQAQCGIVRICGGILLCLHTRGNNRRTTILLIGTAQTQFVVLAGKAGQGGRIDSAIVTAFPFGSEILAATG